MVKLLLLKRDGYSHHRIRGGSKLKHNEILKEYESLSQQKWEYLNQSDAVKANECTDKLLVIIQKLKEAGAIKELESLWSSTNEAVKFESAWVLLESNPIKAAQILSEVQNTKGMLGFTAKMTLKEWQTKNI